MCLTCGGVIFVVNCVTQEAGTIYYCKTLYVSIIVVSIHSTLSVHVRIMYSYSASTSLSVLKKKKYLSSHLVSPAGVEFYHTQTFHTPLPTITSSTTHITLDTGMVALWNRPRQLNDVNTRSPHFDVLDPFPTSTSRHQYCSLLPLNT